MSIKHVNTNSLFSGSLMQSFHWMVLNSMHCIFLNLLSHSQSAHSIVPCFDSRKSVRSQTTEACMSISHELYLLCLVSASTFFPSACLQSSWSLWIPPCDAGGCTLFLVLLLNNLYVSAHCASAAVNSSSADVFPHWISEQYWSKLACASNSICCSIEKCLSFFCISPTRLSHNFFITPSSLC